MGCLRNGITFKLGDLTAFADIFSERRKHAIKMLAAETEDRTQEASMAWEDNEKLASEASNWEALAMQYDSENQQLKVENGTLKFRVEEAGRVRERIDDLEAQVQGVRRLTELPTNLAEVLEYVTRLFPNRIVFSDDARESALEHSEAHDGYWSKPEQLSCAWKMVFDVATRLYELVFVQNSNRLEEDFDAGSQFELAMNEGKQTKKDASLMKQRKVTFRGKNYDITPHVKYGNKPPKILRLHFAIDREDRLLAIGQFGDHLENYSSKKRR